MGRRISLKRTIERAHDFFVNRREGGAAFLAALVALILFALSKIFESTIAKLTTALGADDRALYIVIVAVTLIAFMLYMALHGRYFLRPAPSFPNPHDIRPRGEALRIVPISNVEILDVTQKQLVPDLFGDDTPANDEVYASFAHNSRRSIALYSDNEEKYVGFASFWPIQDEVAKAMMVGATKESDLRREHILPQTDNNIAKYALVPAIAVLGADTKRGKTRALFLMRAFRKFVATEFMSAPDRSITIFAAAYSDDGEKWCKALGMNCTGMVDGADGRKQPLYAKVVTSSDFERLSDLLDG